tara:strand:- start:1755 stop:2555 length:801 start_codon:yes stop_codon:yes gene_type:complete
MQTREPDHVQVSVDPNTCDVMEGHQHDATDIESLADSIATLGQLHPSLIIQYSDGRRLIAAGRRRWMACKSRGIPLIANIWVCEEEDINVELFAKAIRVAENLERCDPSAMDVATQLQAIRNERQLPNARAVAEHVGMSEARVKRYLSLFAASDYLREMASTHALPLEPMLELTRCEKRLGSSSTKKLLAGYIKGELSCSDLAKKRGKPARKKRPPASPEAIDARLRKSGEAMLLAFSKAPPDSGEYLEELIARLTSLLSEERTAS